MTNNYSSNIDFIAHAGRGHDDNPPGRGSGRYAWGSGAKWGKAVNTVKGFFKKKKPAENRVEVSQANREVNTTNPNPLNKLSDDERNRLGGYLENKVSDQDDLFNILDKAYGKHYSMSDMNVDLKNAKKDLKSIGDDNSKSKEVSPQEPKEQHEANRKAALESGDRNQILKYFQESSNEELQRAIIKAGMMDSLNKSISDSKPKIQSAEDLAKTQKEEYIKVALASGDKKQIFLVASDPSVTNNDLVNALNKVNTINNLNKQLNPSKFDKTIEIADKLKSVLDKSLGYYNTTSNVWNILAANYNNSQTVKDNPTKALGYMMQIPNLNQKKDVKKS